MRRSVKGIDEGYGSPVNDPLLWVGLIIILFMVL